MGLVQSTRTPCTLTTAPQNVYLGGEHTELRQWQPPGGKVQLCLDMFVSTSVSSKANEYAYFHNFFQMIKCVGMLQKYQL